MHRFRVGIPAGMCSVGSMLPHLLLSLGLVAVVTAATPVNDSTIAAALEPIRARNHLPALAAAIVNARGDVRVAVVGVRKAGTDVPATLEDSWHLGSDTKAMTATLVGLFIDEGKLKFESTLAEVFPELGPTLGTEFGAISVAQLLAHRAGLPHDAEWRSLPKSGSLVDQRLAAVKAIASDKRVKPAGKEYAYSNWGYVVLGAIAERVGGKPWEELIRERVFDPLGMKSVGFGGTGTPGKIDQPWPHRNGEPTRRNGPAVDNPPVMSPAGRVHCPISEWAKFAANELRGLRGEKTLLTPATFTRLHTPEFGGHYAGGWIAAERPWAQGTAYNHAGSNTMNHCIAWLAPKRDVALLVATNEGDAFKPCDAAIGALIRIVNGASAP